MGNCVIGFPNRIDATFYDVVFSGGSWSRPLTNLADPLLSAVARSSDATTASTWGEVDLGAARDIRVGTFPVHNISRSGQLRLRGSNRVAWSGATVNGSASGGASSIGLQAGATDLVISDEHSFTIAGDETVYRVQGDVTITAGNTGSVSISPTLESAVTGGEAITCRSGDYSSPVVDTGLEDVWQIVYPFGTLPFGHPSFVDGKLSAEKASEGYPQPYVYVRSSLAIARYWRFDIDDTTNADGYIDLARWFLAPGYQPTYDVQFGAQFGHLTNTSMEEALSGARHYERRDPRRRIAFSLANISVDESLAWSHEIQRTQGIDRQVMWVADPDDTVHMHRRAWLGTLRELSDLEYVYTDGVSAPYVLEEVIE